MNTLKQIFGTDYNSSPSVENAQLLMTISDKLAEVGEVERALKAAHEAHSMAEELIASLGVEEFAKYENFGINVPVREMDFNPN